MRETMLDILERAGLDDAARAEALSLLLSHVVGSVVFERSRGGDFRTAELRRRAGLSESEFPRLARASRAVLETKPLEPFERGLAALIGSVVSRGA